MHDVTIVGGSFAGLSAAIYLARGRRDVHVVDAGKPRNRFARHSHGFLTHDGSAPREMLTRARSQVAAYPTVRFTDGEVVDAEAAQGGESFSVTLASGEVLESRRLVLSFGLSDELPETPGLAERWGHSVIHCPYCHGYEFSDRRLGVLYGGEKSIVQAQLVSEWGPVTLFLDGADIDAATLARLEARGVAIEADRVVGLDGEDQDLAGVELERDRTVPLDALYVLPRTHLSSSIATRLGCGLEEGPSGAFLRTDGTRATTVPGVFAAGDIARGAHTVAFAVADGVTAGLAAHRSLVGLD